MSKFSKFRAREGFILEKALKSLVNPTKVNIVDSVITKDLTLNAWIYEDNENNSNCYALCCYGDENEIGKKEYDQLQNSVTETREHIMYYNEEMDIEIHVYPKGEVIFEISDYAIKNNNNEVVNFMWMFAGEKIEQNQ